MGSDRPGMDRAIAATLLVFLLIASLSTAMKKKKQKGKQQRAPARNVTVFEMEPGELASCPGTYWFEEGDSISITSPSYPKHYPNGHNCRWELQASGCQFNIECNDMYTRPLCQGPTWKPLTSCEGDYLRFFSPPMPSVTKEGVQDRFDERFCWTNKANFTFGFSDQLFVRFRSDRRFRARGFNCTITCEEFDFSDLFSRKPLAKEEFEEPLEYDDDDEEEAEEEYEDYGVS